jgi:hypothetical protein
MIIVIHIMLNNSENSVTQLADAYMEQRLALLGPHGGEDVVEDEADGCMRGCVRMSEEHL